MPRMRLQGVWLISVVWSLGCGSAATSAPSAGSAAPGGSAAVPEAVPVTAALPVAAAPEQPAATVPAATAPAAAPAVTRGPPADATIVEYAPGRRGFLYRPDGAGPFPVVVWNHGSEQTPGWQPALAHFYVGHGWAFFLPHRRGHGGSQGTWIGNEHDTAKQAALQDEHNEDVVAAIGWIKTQPAIDPSRVVVSGCSFGGIQTMIVAAKDVGIRAAVPFAAGAILWKHSAEVRERLTRAARESKVPVFLVQAENDYDLGPSRVAGAVLEKAGPGRNRVHVYPPYGTTVMDGHGGFCTKGFDIWGGDVLAFLDRAMKATNTGPAASPRR